MVPGCGFRGTTLSRVRALLEVALLAIVTLCSVETVKGLQAPLIPFLLLLP
jgi:hypothetical protein